MYSSVNALAFTSVQPVTLEELTLELILSTVPLVHIENQLWSYFLSPCFLLCVYLFLLFVFLFRL